MTHPLPTELLEILNLADGKSRDGSILPLRFRGQAYPAAVVPAHSHPLLSTLLRLDETAWRARCFAKAIAGFDPQNPDTQPIVEAVQAIFPGAQVSLFWHVHDQLRLSATTCDELREKATTGAVRYPKGAGRTGAVFLKNLPLRMSDGRDLDALPSWCAPSFPLHPESTYSADRAQRMMLVPVRAAGKAKGVLRVSRAEPGEPFSEEEAEDLLAFGSQLGPLMAAFWHELVYQALWKAPGLSVVISADLLPEVQDPLIVTASAGVKALLDYTPEELLYQSPLSLYSNPEDARHATALAKQKQGGWQPIQSRKKGAERPLPLRIHYQRLKNPLVVPPIHYTLGVAQDDRRREERALLNRVTEQAKIVYFQATSDGRTLTASPSEVTITGYRPDELRERRGRLWANPADREALMQELRQHPDRRVQERLVLLRTKAGHPLHVRADLRLFEQGGAEIVEGLYHVVEERVKLQKYLDIDTTHVMDDQALGERVKERSQAELAFIASAGHQLRAPLANVVENLRNIEDHARRGPVDSERVARTRYLVSRSLEFVGGLTRLYDAVQGTPFREGEVNLARITRELAEDFNPRRRRKRLELHVDFSLDHFNRIHADPDLTRQVLYNYYDNAVKYAHRGTQILVRAITGQIGVEVCSSGLRIPPGDRERIWLNGVRGTEAMRGEAQGAGLGLYLVKRLCVSMGATCGFREERQNNEIFNIFWIKF